MIIYQSRVLNLFMKYGLNRKKNTCVLMRKSVCDCYKRFYTKLEMSIIEMSEYRLCHLWHIQFVP